MTAAPPAPPRPHHRNSPGAAEESRPACWRALRRTPELANTHHSALLIRSILRCLPPAACCLLSAVCCPLPAACSAACPVSLPPVCGVSSWAASATRAALYRGRCSRAAARTRELSAAQSGGSDRRSCIQYTPPNTAQAAASTADTLFCTIVCHSPCLIAFYLLNIHFLRLRSTKRNVLISKTFQWSVGCAHCALSPAPPGCAGREETELTRFKCQLPLCRPALVLHPSSGARGGGRWRTRPRYQLSIVTTGCNQTAPPGQHGARSTIKNKITIKDFQ